MHTLVAVQMMCEGKIKSCFEEAYCMLLAVAYSTECELSLMYADQLGSQYKKIACSCIFSAMCCRHNSPWDGKSPNSIAAAIIYMVTQLPAATNKPSTTTIALECSIAEGTLQSTYRDLYTEKAALIPKWFAKTEDLQQLQQPRERY